MATQLSIVNQALRFLGQAQVDFLSQSDNVTALAKSSWDGTVEWCLRCHAWSHSQKWASLAREAEDPPFSFKASFAVPADCLYIIDIRGDEDLTTEGAEFALVGMHLYTDIEKCLCRYVAKGIDPSFWPSDFCELVAYKLALEMAPTMVPADSAIKNELFQQMQISLDIARANDFSSNKLPELNQEKKCSLLVKRFGG